MAAFLLRRKPAPLPDHVLIEIAGETRKIHLRRNARAKRYLLRVPADEREAVLTVPAGGSLETALDFARRQHGWLAARLSERQAPVDFADGASIPFRGLDHRIRLSGKLRGLVERTDCVDGWELRVPGDAVHLPRKLTDWLKKEARHDLEAAVARHAANIPRKPSAITIRDTRSRWGSCAANGRLSFSWRLVLAPPSVLDYVAAHEVAHLMEMNHGPRFWTLCRRLAPQTEDARQWLKEHGARLHAYG
ncbi:M48 family metallopeptidase [Stappia sp. F7233]|uniref:M48 family metallopeptidase n=1 Tax=Stappia albiluteola TaxID=2758565 RepID=A0A839AJX6_9HYPH|nr:SprT family zinc-dependent metalloprotease [Stappia albiluteola]MBA5778779.1 M48 family metallopeptidase [Stappia albiluteola]